MQVLPCALILSESAVEVSGFRSPEFKDTAITINWWCFLWLSLYNNSPVVYLASTSAPVIVGSCHIPQDPSI